MTDPTNQPASPATGRSYGWWIAVLVAALALAAISWVVVAGRRPPSPPEPPKPILEYTTQPARGVDTVGEAWRRARELESDRRRGERERAAAALPYYVFVVSAKGAHGGYDANAPVAALRMAEIIEKYAAEDNERLAAAKYYLVASGLYIGADQPREASVWRRAEVPFLRAGKAAELAALLARFAENTRARAAELSSSPDPAARRKAIEMADLAVELSRRAGELVRQRPGREPGLAP